jgi:hypothetical protein
MSRNLEARILKLETAERGEMPEGGMVCLVLSGQETEADAWKRELLKPWAVSLTASQRRGLRPVFIPATDANL